MTLWCVFFLQEILPALGPLVSDYDPETWRQLDYFRQALCG